jgi:hypothetical protein
MTAERKADETHRYPRVFDRPGAIGNFSARRIDKPGGKAVWDDGSTSELIITSEDEYERLVKAGEFVETFDHLPPEAPAEQPPFKPGDRVRRSGIDGGEGVVESLDQLATLRLWVSFEDGSEALWPAADCTLVPAKPSDADRWRKLIGPGLRVIGFSGLGTDQAEITLKWSANPKDEPILDDRKLLEQFFDGVKT